MKITITKNQSLFDVAIQEFGSALAVVDLAFENNLSVTDLLVPGQKIIITKSDYKDNEVFDYFKNINKKIATGFQPKKAKESNYGFPYGFPLQF
ncbi:hypothetical protein DK150_550083 [Flavobacterium psychrophilum]|uniref:hypothetical protein n=1 Tax=Flavobacterium psychrophilum TaxID=96345 RepID=UPI000B7C5313|nr:hypothetical protein [Flavobacterium psychrophilum]SNA83445.1 hypothetical protein DK150_550083 [Flavobacterium psychrophilum]